MANQYVDIDTLKFLLYNVHGVQEILDQERYADCDKESIEMLLNSVKDFSDKELFPYFREMDEDPAHFKDGEVLVHPQVNKYMKVGGEMGFISGGFTYKDGGMQLPAMVMQTKKDMQTAIKNR